MKLKKFAAPLAAAACLALTGCVGDSGISLKTNISYKFAVDTGDSVKITLDTSDDYSMTSELPFSVSKDGEVQSQGTFITAETYENYEEMIADQDGVEMLDSGSGNGIEYLFWSYNDAEFNYAVLIKGSDTGLLIGNNVSQKSAEDCFGRMTFTLEK